MSGTQWCAGPYGKCRWTEKQSLYYFVPYDLRLATALITVFLCFSGSSSVKPPHSAQSEALNYRKSSILLSKARPPWDYSSVITDMLKFYADQVWHD